MLRPRKPSRKEHAREVGSDRGDRPGDDRGRSASGDRYAAAWRDSRLPAGCNRTGGGSVGSELARPRVGGRHGGFVFRLPRPAHRCRTELRGPSHGHHLCTRNSPRQIRAQRAGHLGALDGCLAGDLRGRAGRFVIAWAIPALAAAAYYLLAIIAALRWGRIVANAGGPLPPVSVLKPMYGTDSRLYEAIRSHAAQDYPEFEILFGVGNPNDPALADIERLRREFPTRAIRVITTKPDAPNAKAAVLAKLAAEARYHILVVSDDDIMAEPGYLRSVVAPFQKPGT